MELTYIGLGLLSVFVIIAWVRIKQDDHERAELNAMPVEERRVCLCIIHAEGMSAFPSSAPKARGQFFGKSTIF